MITIENYEFQHLPSVKDPNRYKLSIKTSELNLKIIVTEISALGINHGMPVKSSEGEIPWYDIFIYELTDDKREKLKQLLSSYQVIRKEGKPSHLPLLLNPAFTFDKFIVGENNKFAHSAAIAVSNKPGLAYNPLFIYGGVGLGKTHLMQAIGHEINSKFPDLNTYYTSARDFMDEVVNSIAQGKLFELRSKYKYIDVLLIDDVQFLAGSEATQEEFFHIFNELYNAKKQIVLTSDRPPKLLTTLEDRIRSRFEWGLIVDIKPPSLETRMAILKKKSEFENLTIDDEILLFVAKKLKSNIRELEGFLKRIQAYATLLGQPITMALAEEIMKELLPPEEEIPKEEIKPQKIYVSPTRPTVTKIPTTPIQPAPSVKIEEDLSLKPVSVAFFYPFDRVSELQKVKEKFREIIKKHKLKFRLEPLFEQEYTYTGGDVNYLKIVNLCEVNKVKIAILLGPPPDSQVSNEEFYNNILPLMESSKVTLEYLPWHELEKDYRYLNLALDIALSVFKF